MYKNNKKYKINIKAKLNINISNIFRRSKLYSIEYYMPDAAKLGSYYYSNKYLKSRNYSSILTKEDFIQVAYMGLIKAYNNFIPGKAMFKTYAFYRMRGELLDFMRGEDILSRHTRELCKKAFQGTKDYKDISIETIVERTGITSNKAEKLKVHYNNGTISSVGVEFYDEAFLLDENNLNQLDNKLIFAKILENFHQLESSERDIITKFYLEEKSIQEIKTDLNLSEISICKIKNKAIRKLKKILKIKNK